MLVRCYKKRADVRRQASIGKAYVCYLGIYIFTMQRSAVRRVVFVGKMISLDIPGKG